MASILTITPDDLADPPRPVRIGCDLEPADQETALATMAPAEMTASQARAWLSSHVFVVTQVGRLDRHTSRPVARLEVRA